MNSSRRGMEFPSPFKAKLCGSDTAIEVDSPIFKPMDAESSVGQVNCAFERVEEACFLLQKFMEIVEVEDHDGSYRASPLWDHAYEFIGFGEGGG